MTCPFGWYLGIDGPLALTLSRALLQPAPHYSLLSPLLIEFLFLDLGSVYTGLNSIAAVSPWENLRLWQGKRNTQDLGKDADPYKPDIK